MPRSFAIGEFADELGVHQIKNNSGI
jgi:hypothetical protein